MKKFEYGLFGVIIGLFIGILVGSVFGIAYVKQSQRGEVSLFQAVIGGLIGTVIGLNIGIKIADEEEEKEFIRQKYEEEKRLEKKRYEESLETLTCKICGVSFIYSTLEDIYENHICKSCSYNIKFISKSFFDLVYKCKNEIKNLKRLHAKISRYDNMINEAQKLLEFEEKGASIENIVPSEFLEELYTQKANLIKNEIQSELNILIEKVNSQISNKRKATLLEKFVEKLYDYNNHISYEKDIVELINFINTMILKVNNTDVKEIVIIPDYKMLK